MPAFDDDSFTVQERQFFILSELAQQTDHTVETARLLLLPPTASPPI